MSKLILIETPFNIEEYQKNSETKYIIWLPPLWALSLASYLKSNLGKLNVKIFDGQLMSLAQIKKAIKQERPDYVGLSPKRENYLRTLKLARFAKKEKCQIIMGGFYADSLAIEIMTKRGPWSDDYCVDYVIRGDGEEAITRLIAGKDKSRINNLVYNKGAKVILNPLKIVDFKKLPRLDFSFLNINDYIIDYQSRYHQLSNHNIIRSYFQKGCAWREKNKQGCLYCHTNTGSIRLRSVNNIYQEIRELVAKFQINRVSDISDMSFENQSWIKQLIKLKNKDEFLWPSISTLVRVNKVNQALINYLKELKIEYINLGIESGDNQCLKNINVGFSVEQAKKAIKLLNQNQIKIALRFMIGLPNESKRSLNKTVKLIENLKTYFFVDRIVVNQFMPFPGTAIWHNFIKKVSPDYKNNDFPDLEKAQYEWIEKNTNVTNAHVQKINVQINKIVKSV